MGTLSTVWNQLRLAHTVFVAEMHCVEQSAALRGVVVHTCIAFAVAADVIVCNGSSGAAAVLKEQEKRTAVCIK